MLDVLILSTPRIAPVRPASAAPLLKAICNAENKTSKIFDLNQDFYMNFANEHQAAGKEIDDYFIMRYKELDGEVFDAYASWLEKWINRIIHENPKLLAISVFSWQSQKFVYDLLKSLRNSFSGKIIIGGQGLENSQNMSSHWVPRAGFAQFLLDEKLIDYFIKGEADKTFAMFLRGEQNIPGLNKHENVALNDINEVPVSDFSDLNLDGYFNGYAGGVIPIESCRGCVRSCSFCEMSSEHGAYRRKDGVALAEEVIHYYKTYKVQHYYFHDDLMNGNVKDFNNFLDRILKFYQDNNLPDRTFSFSGYWIVRSEKQFGVEQFKKFYRAGGNTFVTGVETGSDRLRKTMRKGFTNKDLEFTLDQISALGMKFYFLIIAGLPGETDDDFQETLNRLTKWQKYVATGAIIGINLGTTATIEPGTHIYDNYKEYKLVGVNGERPKGIQWMCLETPELDYKERVRRRVKMQEHVLSLGYPMWKGDDHLKIIMDRYKESNGVVIPR